MELGGSVQTQQIKKVHISLQKRCVFIYRAGTLYLALVQRSVILSGSEFDSRRMLHTPTPITAFYFPERVERIERTFANTVCGMTFSRFVRVLPFFFSCLSTLLIYSISDASPQNVYHRLAVFFFFYSFFFQGGGVGIMSRLEMVSSVSPQYDILHALEAMRSSTTVRRGLQNKMFTSATSRGPGAYLVGLAGFFTRTLFPF